MSRLSQIAIIATLGIIPSLLRAQAYCALRDPVRGIYKAFPEAETHRSIVRSMTKRVRSQIAKDLPFTLHFNELGRHTLYVPTKGNKPLGLIHVRSEEGDWGMVEIAWALDLSLEVKDFRFQRCRSREKKNLQTDAFKDQLRGKSLGQLRDLLTADCKSLKQGALKLEKSAQALAVTVIRSGLKTMAATRYGWKEDLLTLNLLNHAYTAFPSGKSLERVSGIYTKDVIRDLSRFLDSNESLGINRKSASMIRVLDKDKQLVGCAIRAEWSSGMKSAVLWWNILPDLTILDVIVEGEWPSKGVERAFRTVRGLSFNNIDECSTTAQLVSAEALIIARALEQPRPAKPGK